MRFSKFMSTFFMNFFSVPIFCSTSWSPGYSETIFALVRYGFETKSVFFLGFCPSFPKVSTLLIFQKFWKVFGSFHEVP